MALVGSLGILPPAPAVFVAEGRPGNEGRLKPGMEKPVVGLGKDGMLKLPNWATGTAVLMPVRAER